MSIYQISKLSKLSHLRNLCTILFAGAVLIFIYEYSNGGHHLPSNEPCSQRQKVSPSSKRAFRKNQRATPTHSSDQQKTDAFLERHHKYLKQRIRRVCEANKQTLVSDVRQLSPQSLGHILVDMDHKLLYCFVPKNGCTNWKRIWLILTNKTAVKNPLNISKDDVHDLFNSSFRALGSIPAKERPHIVKSFLTFVIVRDPIQRLISAYRDKIYPLGKSLFSPRKQVVKFSAEQHRNQEAIAQNFVPFHDFLTFIHHGFQEGAMLDEHWGSQADLCQPCAIDYDIIGSFNHLEDEARYILRAAKVEHIVKYPSSSNKLRTKFLMKDMYYSVSDALIKALYFIYRADYMMFGFPYHTFGRPTLSEFKMRIENSSNLTLPLKQEITNT